MNLTDLHRRLLRDVLDVGTGWFDDEAFTAYGLTEHDVSDLRTRARAWSDDIAERISQQVNEDDLP